MAPRALYPPSPPPPLQEIARDGPTTGDTWVLGLTSALMFFLLFFSQNKLPPVAPSAATANLYSNPVALAASIAPVASATSAPTEAPSFSRRPRGGSPCSPPPLADAAAVAAFFAALSPTSSGLVAFGGDAISLGGLPRTAVVDAAPAAAAPLLVCVAVPQPRALYIWQHDHRLVLSPQVTGRWPRTHGLPDDIRFRVFGGDRDEPLAAPCTLLTPPEGARVPSWPEAANATRLSVRWRNDAVYPDGSLGPFWGAAAEGFLPPNESDTVTVPAPTHATVYECVLGDAALAALARVSVASGGTRGATRIAVVASVEHASFSWHAQARSKHGDDAQFDETGGYPDALLAHYAPAALPELTIDMRGVAAAAARAAVAARPPCERADAPGAWVPTAEPGALGPAADGRFWRAHDCAFTTGLTPRCLLPRFRSARFFGDSHVRRAWKDMRGRAAPLARLGANASTWCIDARAERRCVCEDGHEGGAFEEGDGRNAFGGSGGEPRVAWAWGGGGFVERDWRGALEALLANDEDPRPPIVVFDSVHWDAAFSTFFRFKRELEAFIAMLANFFSMPDNSTLASGAAGDAGWVAARTAAAPSHPLLVYRTPTYYLGADTGNLRKYTAARVELFHTHALKQLRARFGGHLLVWDAFAVGAARPIATALKISDTCWSAHEPSEDTGILNDVLLNALCNG